MILPVRDIWACYQERHEVYIADKQLEEWHSITAGCYSPSKSLSSY
jgi:hypothetical protein